MLPFKEWGPLQGWHGLGPVPQLLQLSLLARLWVGMLLECPMELDDCKQGSYSLLEQYSSRCAFLFDVMSVVAKVRVNLQPGVHSSCLHGVDLSVSKKEIWWVKF